MLNHRVTEVKGEKTENDKRETEDDGRWTRGRKKTDEKETKKIKTVRDLKVYRKAFDSAMEIFKYIDEDTFQRLDDDYEHIFAMLNAMENKVDTFCRPSS